MINSAAKKSIDFTCGYIRLRNCDIASMTFNRTYEAKTRLFV